MRIFTPCQHYYYLCCCYYYYYDYYNYYYEHQYYDFCVVRDLVVVSVQTRSGTGS